MGIHKIMLNNLVINSIELKSSIAFVILNFLFRSDHLKNHMKSHINRKLPSLAPKSADEEKTMSESSDVFSSASQVLLRVFPSCFTAMSITLSAAELFIITVIYPG